MRAFGPESLMRLSFALCIGIATAQGLQAATPGFTIKAGNVSVSGQGSGTSQFTVTSVGGYAGTVYVTCSGPDGNLLSDLLLPVCGSPVEEALPANGSVSGSMSFTPPSSVTSSAKLQGGPPGPPRPMPYVAGVLAWVCWACACGGFSTGDWRWWLEQSAWRHWPGLPVAWAEADWPCRRAHIRTPFPGIQLPCLLVRRARQFR